MDRACKGQLPCHVWALKSAQHTHSLIRGGHGLKLIPIRETFLQVLLGELEQRHTRSKVHTMQVGEELPFGIPFQVQIQQGHACQEQTAATAAKLLRAPSIQV